MVGPSWLAGAIALTDHSAAAAAAVARFLRQGASARAQEGFGKNYSLQLQAGSAYYLHSAAEEKKLVLSALFVKNKGRMC